MLKLSIRPGMQSALRMGVVAGLALALSACSAFKKEDASGGQDCPSVRVDRNTATMTQFRDGSGRDLTDVVFGAEIVDYAGDCQFDKKTNTVNVRMKVLFAITEGPAETQPTNTLQYFVAVPSFYPAPAAKQVLGMDFKYPDGNVATMMVRDEEVRLSIPLEGRTTKETPIYIGFQLTEEQLEYNRRQHQR